MRQAVIKYNNLHAGVLKELDTGEYEFAYDEKYILQHPNQFITFQMPVNRNVYRSKRLFPFFDGLIPEGWLLTIAAETWRINKNDRMGLLMTCCKNTVGAVSVHPIIENQNE
jgi:serine/threonine-protein kinase HipA